MAPTRRFWAAVEYFHFDPAVKDVLDDGWRAAVAQRAQQTMEVYNRYFSKVWRCVRVIAEIADPVRNAPEVPYKFHQGDIMFDLDEQEYRQRYDEIPWTWTEQ
jgi:hypothetical protein